MANALAGHVLQNSLQQSCRQQIRSSRVPTAAFLRPAIRVSRIARIAARAAEEKKADLSGEWPVNWSLASYEDVGEFFKNSLFKEDAGQALKDVMATSVKSVTPDTTIDSLGNLFDTISGVPVTKSQSDKTLVGVLSKKDLKKASTCRPSHAVFHVLLCLCKIDSLDGVDKDSHVACRVEAQLLTSCPHLRLLPGLRTRSLMQL